MHFRTYIFFCNIFMFFTDIYLKITNTIMCNYKSLKYRLIFAGFSWGFWFCNSTLIFVINKRLKISLNPQLKGFVLKDLSRTQMKLTMFMIAINKTHDLLFTFCLCLFHKVSWNFLWNMKQKKYNCLHENLYISLDHKNNRSKKTWLVLEQEQAIKHAVWRII